jgi:hypothetical protein
MAADKVTAESVYSCTGKPKPKEIEQILHWLFNEDFESCFTRIFIF